MTVCWLDVHLLELLFVSYAKILVGRISSSWLQPYFSQLLFFVYMFIAVFSWKCVYLNHNLRTSAWDVSRSILVYMLATQFFSFSFVFYVFDGFSCSVHLLTVFMHYKEGSSVICVVYFLHSAGIFRLKTNLVRRTVAAEFCNKMLNYQRLITIYSLYLLYPLLWCTGWVDSLLICVIVIQGVYK